MRGGFRLTAKLNITHMGIEQRTKQDSGEANFADLAEEKYDKPANGQETIEGQTAQVEKEIQANIAVLNENITRLPDPETVSVDEHPGLREKLESYKESLLRNKEWFMTKLGLGTASVAGPIWGLAASQGGFLNLPATAESDIGIALTATAVGIFVAGLDQIAGRVSAYLETGRYKEELLGLRKRHV